LKRQPFRLQVADPKPLSIVYCLRTSCVWSSWKEAWRVRNQS
jgi:hypothetical protein